MFDKIKAWLQTALDFCKELWAKLLVWLDPYLNYLKEHPVLAYVLMITAGAMLLTLLIAMCIGAKRRKARKRLAKAQANAVANTPAVEEPTIEVEPIAEEPIVEEPVAEETPIAEEPIVEEPIVEEPIVEEPVAEETPIAEEPIVEEPIVEEPIVEEPIVEEPIVEEPIVEEPIVEEAPIVEEPIVKPEKAEKPAGPMLYDELKDVEEENDVWYDENETDKAAKYSGKWLICRIVADDNSTDESYFFELHASNGEKLLSSEEYTSYQGALRGIETHKANILNNNFRITISKKGDYIFKLLSGKNLLLCMGENYPTRARCESAIESTKRFAQTAVVDENVQDHIIKVPVEDDNEILPLSDGYNGKWIVNSRIDENGHESFWFELFANNGEKLLSSEDYASYTGAINGIQTHKANIEKGNFRISLTKRGDYIYKLLNGNGQLLCLGEHYKTKYRCQNAVESVKRFAKYSPLLTSAEHIH